MEVLSWILRAPRALRMDELLEALAVEDGDEDLEREFMLQPSQIVESCKSLVIYDESNGVVRFSHYTVKQFIERELQNKLPPTAHLAMTCLAFLDFSRFNDLCADMAALDKAMEEYKFINYVALFWALHTKGEAEQSAGVQRAIFGLLSSEQKRRTLLQMEKIAETTVSWLRTVIPTQYTILHLVAQKGLSRICRLVLDGRGNENEM
jgi:hypothetical protein